MLQEAGYEIKRGKNISIRGKEQKRFIRLSSLPENYQEKAIREFFENPAGRIFVKRSKQHRQESRVNLLIDVQQKLQTKGPGYARWAKIHNLKEMSKSLLFLREHGFETMEQLDAFIAEKTERRDKRPPGTRSQNASFVHKGLGLSQQVLRPSERGRRPGGDPGPCLRGSL